MADLASWPEVSRLYMAHAFREKPLKGACFWRFSHEHLPYISEMPPYEPQNLPYVSEIGGIIKHFPALMSRRTNQTTKFCDVMYAKLATNISLHICRNNMVSVRPFPMLGRPLHAGRKAKLVRVELSACRRERARPS